MNANQDTSLTIEELRDSNVERAHARFVDGHASANLYHTLAWRDFLVSVFRHEPVYLVARSGDKVCGVLPAFLVRVPPLGRKLVSLPYDVGSGGPLCDDAFSSLALVERLVAIARERRCQYLELRGLDQPLALERLGFRIAHPVVLSSMTLPDRESVDRAIQKDHRKAVRKAESRGVSVREAVTRADFEAFYRVYLHVFRAFGTPPYGPRYFDQLRERLAPSRAVRILLAEHEGRTVGGLQLFAHGRNLVSKFAACLPDAVPLRAYPMLYRRAIDLALDEGYRTLGWGTSAKAQTGLIEYKAGWGSVSQEPWVAQLDLRGKAPDLARYYDEGGLVKAVWKRLPLAATKWLGGPINRWFC